MATSSPVLKQPSTQISTISIIVLSAYLAGQLISNIASLKIGTFFSLAVDMGTFLYPITFTLRDLVHKNLGKKAARTIIWAAGIINLLMTAYLAFAAGFPAHETWPLQPQFEAIFSPMWRIVFASIIAQIIAELLDTEMYAYIADKHPKVPQWARVLGSNSISIPIDNFVFCVIAFYSFGFVAGDFVVRVSDRHAWIDFASQHGVAEESIPDFLNIVDKIEREKPEVLTQKLAAFSLTAEQVRSFIADPTNASPAYLAIREDLTARGLGDFIELDLSIVRGLAYYTGVVFEVFDSKKSMRAVAGGGRYDTLIATISDGAVDLPATGFAMGDYVIRNLIEETTHAAMQMEVWLQRNAAACEVFVVVADETKRAESLKLVTELRRAGISADFSLKPAKVAKQFQSAEKSGARFALVVGTEYPELKLKILASRCEESGNAESAIDWLSNRLQQPDGPLLA
jgi:histidyl-tRNA synthetase